MDKYIYDEKNGLWYELQGDYYLPCLKLPEEPEGGAHRYLGAAAPALSEKPPQGIVYLPAHQRQAERLPYRP